MLSAVPMVGIAAQSAEGNSDHQLSRTSALKGKTLAWRQAENAKLAR